MRGVKRSYETSSSMSISICCSSYDLQDVWKRACWKAMGLTEDGDEIDDDTWELVDHTTTMAHEKETTSPTAFQVINLIPPSMYIQGDEEDDEIFLDNSQTNPFMNMAQQIQGNIDTMRNWLHQKLLTYIQLTTSDSEASLIQSTITSFTATTANEIESLHQIIRNNHNNHHNHSHSNSHSTKTNIDQQSQTQQHLSSIVQILMMELQDTIAVPFQQLTKLRHRTAVQMYQNPIQCRIYTPKLKTSKDQQQQRTKKQKDTTLELLGLDDDDDEDEAERIAKTKMIDQRFVPTRPSHRLHQDFYTTYEQFNNEIAITIPRPISIFISTSTTSNSTSSTNHTTLSKSSLSTTSQKEDVTTNRSSILNQSMSTKKDPNFTYHNEYDTSTATMLQQESLLLQMKTNNDLDSVQQMEQTMMDITTLLSQFTNLVVEQQDNIHTIYDTTTTTHDNIQKGTENLHEAKIRVQSSKHYMASMITGMGIILLIFHWLRP